MGLLSSIKITTYAAAMTVADVLEVNIGIRLLAIFIELSKPLISEIFNRLSLQFAIFA